MYVIITICRLHWRPCTKNNLEKKVEFDIFHWITLFVIIDLYDTFLQFKSSQLKLHFGGRACGCKFCIGKQSAFFTCETPHTHYVGPSGNLFRNLKAHNSNCIWEDELATAIVNKFFLPVWNSSYTLYTAISAWAPKVKQISIIWRYGNKAHLHWQKPKSKKPGFFVVPFTLTKNP